MNSHQDEIADSEAKITLGADFYQLMTPGAASYLQRTVKDYAEKLIRESQSLAKMDSIGDERPEITTAHVEESKWIISRRMKKQAPVSPWLPVLRVGQFAMTALVGVGASLWVHHAWGAVLCVLSILIGSMLLLIEREMSKGI